MIQAIYSCKLYKASPRKAKIQAAMSSPLNLELVTQLNSYLDPEYRKKKVEDTEPEESYVVDLDVSESSEESSFSDGPISSSPAHPYSPSSPSSFDDGDINLDSPSEEHTLADDVSEVIDDVSDAPADIDSTDSDEVTSAEDVDVVPETFTHDDVDNIKTTLNSNGDTKGVNRALVKDTELWIYYEDDVNLNNVMAPVIELLNDGQYRCLEFNRLARSVNAIVFQINGAEGANER